MSGVLEPNDIVSFSAEARSITGADRMRLVVEQHGERQALELVDPSGNVLTLAGHGFVDDDIVQLALDTDEEGQPVGQLPDGLTDLTDYFVVNATADTFQVSTSVGGPPVDLVDAGTESIYVFRLIQRDFGSEVQTDTFGTDLSRVENVTVHDLFSEFAFFGENLDDTEDGEIRRLMCVRGPSATGYTEPVFMWGVHDATMIHLSSGEIVEAEIQQLKVSEIIANRIKSGTIGAEVINVGGINLNLDGINSRINVQDNQAIPATRVRLGKLGPGDNDYGLELYDGDGNKVIGFGGALYRDGTDINDLQPAEPDAERTTGAGTGQLVDDAGLGESADWAAVDGVPDTLNEHGITDGQTDLGPSTDDRQVLHRDIGGDAYWATKLDLGESNMGSFRPLAGNTPVPYHSTNFTRLGNVIVLANPGRAVALKVDVHILAVMNVGDSARVAIKPWISVDGGVTEVTTGGGADPDDPSVAYPTAKSGQTCASTAFVWQGTPTGDIHIGMQGRQVDNVGSVGLREQTVVSFIVGPNSEYSIVVGELVATVPSARSGSCSKHFTSGTTCNAAATVTASVTGGTPDYSYAWAKVSGTDSITAGATSKTCTVSGTHTTADPSAVHQTTVKCTVTDDAAEVASSGNCVVSLSYKRTYSDVFVSAPSKNFGCSVRVGLMCTSEGELSRSAGGGDGDYSDSWTKVSGEGSIVSGATTSSPLVRHNGIATEPATTYVGVFKDTVTDGRGDSASDNAQVNFTHTGF